MLPHERPGGPHVHPEWMINDERERDVKDAGGVLERIGGKLRENGEVTISGVRVAPGTQCWTVVRFERMPRGELSLKLELKWESTEEVSPATGEELDIE